MKDTSKEHKEKAPVKLGFAVVTMSSTRSVDEDDSGKLIMELAEKAGHEVHEHLVLPDDEEKIKGAVMGFIEDEDVQVVVMNGGTGIAKKDVTIEAIRPLFEKEITAFGSIFAKLSFDEVGSVSMLSRATAGIANGTVMFSIPGSPRACKLAMEKLILPEAGHVAKHLGD